MKWPARWLGLRQDGWAAEECAYLAGLLLTLGILVVLTALGMPNKAASLGLFAYVIYRLFDIVSYELEIVFADRHKDLTTSGGHLLSADRRVLCTFIHLLDFIACYAILFLALGSLQGARAFDGGAISTPVRALYLSVIIASFTGLSEVTPGTNVARLAVMSEVVLELVLFAILFATIVGSMGPLTEMKPRPPRAARIFGRRRRASKSGEASQQQHAAHGTPRRR
jgi:hypothetical protein